MIKKGKVKFCNNYWMDMGDGTWTNYDDYYDVVVHDFGAYTIGYLYQTASQKYVSTDGGKTYTEKDLEVAANCEARGPFMNIIDMDAIVRRVLNPYNIDKIITWEEPLTEVPQE